MDFRDNDFCIKITCTVTQSFLLFPMLLLMEKCKGASITWQKRKFEQMVLQYYEKSACRFCRQIADNALKEHIKSIMSSLGNFRIFSIGLMHDDVLLISFTTTPRSHAVFARFFHISCWYSFQFLSHGKHLHFECEAWW